MVIGTGFGGAVAALRLGQAGFHTVVLERGRRWDVDPAGETFCTINSPDRRAAWFANRPPIGLDRRLRRIGRWAGILDRQRGCGIDAVTGVGVGGSSLVFSAFLVQPRRSDFERVFPAGFGYDDLDRIYWPRVRRMLKSAPVPDDVLCHPRYVGARAWLRYVAEFGATPVRHDMCVDWDVVRDELAGRAVASQSVGEGTYGNNSGSKHSVDRNYLAQAQATGMVTVLPLHVAYRIQEVVGSEGKERFEVRARQIDESGAVLADKLFVCDFLFLAMGAMFTPAMAVAMKAQGRLSRLNDEVGKGWSNNGDFLMVRTDLRRTVGVRQGGPGIALFHDDDNPFGPAVMQYNAAPFPGLLQMLPNGAILRNNTIHLVMGLPQNFGHFAYDSATRWSRLIWPHHRATTATELGALHLAARFRHRTEGTQGSRLTGLPVASRRFDLGAAITYHPLGGMVMGRACDLDGRVRGYRNLYIVDGSLLPGSAANANPAFTIAAVAERCMDQFMARG